MRYKAAIFDMDGTLVDTMGVWREVLKGGMMYLGHSMTNDDFIKFFTLSVDEGKEYLIEKSVNKGLSAATQVDEAFNSMYGEMKRRYEQSIPAKPYALDFVKKLHDLGMPLCVATQAVRSQAEVALERLGFSPYLEFVITGKDVGCSKEFPDIFLEAARRLGSTPENTAVFEDNLTAIKTAHNAGFVVCGVYEQYQPHSFEDIVSLCDFTILDFKDVV